MSVYELENMVISTLYEQMLFLNSAPSGVGVVRCFISNSVLCWIK